MQITYNYETSDKITYLIQLVLVTVTKNVNVFKLGNPVLKPSLNNFVRRLKHHQITGSKTKTRVQGINCKPSSSSVRSPQKLSVTP